MVIQTKNEINQLLTMFTELWRREFSFSSLTLRHDTPADFYTSQWQKNKKVNVVYLLYRWMMALAFLVTLVLSIVGLGEPEQDASKRAKWLIYLTHWGYAICTLQSILAVYIVTSVFIKQRRKTEYVPEKHLSPIVYCTYWVLFTIAVDAAFAITSIYWSLIYDSKTHSLDVINVFVHIINAVFMLMDLLVVAHPIRILHCYWPFGFALIYVIFNAMYYVAGGTDKFGKPYIYSILNWTNLGRSVFVTFFALMFLVFLHAVAYCIYLLRKNLHGKVRILATNTNTLTINLEEAGQGHKEIITDRLAAV